MSYSRICLLDGNTVLSKLFPSYDDREMVKWRFQHASQVSAMPACVRVAQNNLPLSVLGNFTWNPTLNGHLADSSPRGLVELIGDSVTATRKHVQRGQWLQCHKQRRALKAPVGLQ